MIVILPSRVKSNHVATQKLIVASPDFRDGLCNPRRHPRLHFRLGDGEKHLSLSSRPETWLGGARHSFGAAICPRRGREHWLIPANRADYCVEGSFVDRVTEQVLPEHSRR
jgi:hypothetical protein